MTRSVPYLADEAIERDAVALLAEYARACHVTIEPPIPIEDIVEKYLKLGIEFDDTHRLFGVPRIGLDPDIRRCRRVGGNWRSGISSGMRLSLHAARSMH
jgi:hypothetical protein